jgi:hypothetical protein
MRFAFVASDTSIAQEARRKLVDRYDDVPPEQAELIVALGCARATRQPISKFNSTTRSSWRVWFVMG